MCVSLHVCLHVCLSPSLLSPPSALNSLPSSPLRVVVVDAAAATRAFLDAAKVTVNVGGIVVTVNATPSGYSPEAQTLPGSTYPWNPSVSGPVSLERMRE